MGRPKRKKGGGRVTPKRTRPEYQHDRPADYEFYDHEYRHEIQIQPVGWDPLTDSILELWVRDAEGIIEERVGIDEADRWASCIQSGIASRWSPEGDDASELLSYASHSGGPAGAVLAAAIAVYGPPEVRSRARRLLRRLDEEDGDVPAWVRTLGEAMPLRAVRIVDRWDEHSTVMIDYQRPDGTVHGLSVAFDPFCSGMAYGFSLDAPSTQLDTADDPLDTSEDTDPAHRGPLHRGPRTLHDPLRTADDISLADARALIETGLRARDEVWAEVDDLDELDLDEELRALVEQRTRLLPRGGNAPERPTIDADEVASLLRDFVSQPVHFGEHAQELGDLLNATLRFTMTCRDRDILRWTPTRVAAFLDEWILEHGFNCEECGTSHEHPPDEEWLTTVESAFPRWLRFAAERKCLAGDVREANLAAARESLKQMRHHATGSLASPLEAAVFMCRPGEESLDSVNDNDSKASKQ